MQSLHITAIDAMEILDSRGYPTVEASVALSSGMRATSSVPSGTSIGAHEAVELRDRDPLRYAGRGVQQAVSNIRDLIAPALCGMDPTDQERLDERLIELDGTADKGRLGANAMLAVSQACARAAARSQQLPLYAYLSGGQATRLPVPMANVVNGGKHADSGLDVQEVMIVPLGAPSFAESLRYVAETFYALQRLLSSSGLTVAVGDEGGFAPLVRSNEEAFDLVIEAIERAGYRPGKDIALALDVAASSFHQDGRYKLWRTDYRTKTSSELTAMYRAWVEKYPIVSIEDPLAESDWYGFQALTAELGESIQIVGDDLLVTNTRFIERGIEEKVCNAALIRLNQIGTLTEAVKAIELCRHAGWEAVVSHRSGETCDNFLADFAVAMGSSRIKAGSICRGERVSKYNRLLTIERELGARARFIGA
ncbi:phosphopyruvate hydratase [Ottowia sp.]|uniref:phosphopyruvate hydratase n=1 Tax=Ottowia sp. TaxID=1898956 RepID=UPI002CC747BE|nr:phosphopyruvate hydratase [Ottowia sp.]HNR82260.1 phosphopyruvate hydratase [Ottowia sp.]HNU10652.1 phosphopyruvate hydratase [Rubrivivax sp.]